MDTDNTLRERFAYPDAHLEDRLQPEQVLAAGRRVRRRRRVAAGALTLALVAGAGGAVAREWAGDVIQTQPARPLPEDEPPATLPGPVVPEPGPPGSVVDARVLREAAARTLAARTVSAATFRTRLWSGGESATSTTWSTDRLYGEWDLSTGAGAFDLVNEDSDAPPPEPRTFLDAAGTRYVHVRPDDRGGRRPAAAHEDATQWVPLPSAAESLALRAVSARADAGSPVGAVRWLESVQGPVRYVGTSVLAPQHRRVDVGGGAKMGVELVPAEVAGTRVRHFTVDVDLRSARAVAPRLFGVRHEARSATPRSARADVWVTEDGLVHGVTTEIVYDREPSPDASMGRVDRYVEVTGRWLRDSGRQVDLAPPPTTGVPLGTAEFARMP